MRNLLPFFILLFVYSGYGQPVYRRPPAKPKTVGTPALPNFNTVLATEKCSLTYDRFPRIREIYLGMTSEQIKILFPSVSFNVSADFPDSTFTLVYPKSKPNFEEVSYIFFSLFENKVVRFQINYLPTVEWSSIDEYKNQLASTFNIPMNNWSVIKDIDKTGLAKTECQDFTISAYLSLISNELGYSLTIEKNDYYKEMVNKTKLKKEEKKRTFKP